MTPVHVNGAGGEPNSTPASAKGARPLFRADWISQWFGRGRRLLLVWIWILASQVHGQINLSPSAPRYLFLVDCSSSMSRMSGSTRQLVFDLIFTGAQGRMESGGVYELWLFNERAITNQFRPMNWDPLLNRALANNASEFLKGVRYEKTVRWDRAWLSLAPLIKSQSPLTIFMVSNGGEEMLGTPFDKGLNEIYRKHAREARREKIPILTTFEARQGRLAAFVVSRPGSAIPFESLDEQLAQLFPQPTVSPSIPKSDSRPPALSATPVPALEQPKAQPPSPDLLKPEPKAAEQASAESPKPALVKIEPTPQESALSETTSQTEVVVQETNSVATEQILAPPVSTINPPAVAPPPSQEQVSPTPVTVPPAASVRQEPLVASAMPAPVVSPEPEITAALTNGEPPKSEAKLLPGSTPESALARTNPSEIESNLIRPVQNSTNPPLATPAVASATPEVVTNRVADTPVSALPPPMPNFNLPPPASAKEYSKAPVSYAWRYLVPGTLLLMAGLVIVWAMKHRAKPKNNPSFISRSIERELR